MKKQKIYEDGKGRNYHPSSNNHIFQEFAINLMGNKQIKPVTEKEPDRNPAYHPINLEYAKEKIHQSETNVWLEKTHRAAKKSMSLYNFVVEFFNELDTSRCGKLKGEKLLESLVYLGIATDPLVIRRTLCLIYKCKDLTTLRITCKDFTELFKNDSKTDRILKQLNENCVSAREGKARKNVESIAKIETSSSIFKKNTERNSAHNATGIKFVRNYEENLITINEHLEIITGWWKELDTRGINQVPIDDVIEYFLTIGLAKDQNESKTLISSQIGAKANLIFDEFQQIFAKSMLKGALFNLSQRLSDEKFADKEMSSGFKLLSYQRALLLSGVKCPNSDITEEEGAKTVHAIEKFNHQTNRAQK